MGINIFLGFVLIVGSVFIHAVTTYLCTSWANRKFADNHDSHWSYQVWNISILVFMLFFAAVIEAVLWAFAYYGLGAITDFVEAVYFSLVTYTTLGYGDITLEGRLRLLSAFQAANGVIIFGWSTAVVMALVQRIFTSNTNQNDD